MEIAAILRHGQDWDDAVTPYGRNEILFSARFARRFFLETNPVIICSEWGRGIETAEIVSRVFGGLDIRKLWRIDTNWAESTVLFREKVLPLPHVIVITHLEETGIFTRMCAIHMDMTNADPHVLEYAEMDIYVRGRMTPTTLRFNKTKK